MILHIILLLTNNLNMRTKIREKKIDDITIFEMCF